jgi:hypothetical protein
MKWWTVRVVFLLAMIFCLFFLVGKDSEKDVRKDIYQIAEKISDFYFLNGKSFSNLQDFQDLEGCEKNQDGTSSGVLFVNNVGTYTFSLFTSDKVGIMAKGKKLFSTTFYFVIESGKGDFLCVYPEWFPGEVVDCLVKQQSGCDEGFRGFFYGNDRKVFVIEKK